MKKHIIYLKTFSSAILIFQPKKKLNILTRVINNISNKYDGADLKTKMDTKSALQKEYVDRKSFDVEEIGNKLFGKSPEKKIRI